MSEKMYCDPAEILEVTVQKGIAKASTSVWKLLCLGFLVGVFIAFASEGSNMAACGLFAKPETYGLGKFVAGLIFPSRSRHRHRDCKSAARASCLLL